MPARRPLFDAEGDDLGAAVARDLRGAVGRAVVDDHDVRVGQVLPQLLEHRREVVLLVPGRDEDDRVVRLPAHGSDRTSPPSTATTCPVTYDAAGDSRNAATRASSAGSP